MAFKVSQVILLLLSFATPIFADPAERLPVHSVPVDVDGTETLLNFYDDGTEPVDTIANFIRGVKGATNGAFQNLVATVLPNVCGTILPCTRVEPIVWQKRIDAEDGTPIGTLAVLAGREPVDEIDGFVRTHGLEPGFRTSLLEPVCRDLAGICTRTVPVVYEKEVNGDDGSKLGSVVILEGEEVADAVYRFLKTAPAGAAIDVGQLKNYFFEEVCGKEIRVSCTRTASVVFDREMNAEDGSALGRLVITDESEGGVLGAVTRWSAERGLTEEISVNIVRFVCSNEGGVKCQ